MADDGPHRISEPWFHDGLAFECSRCGDCCRGPGYVWVDQDEIEVLAAHLEMSLGGFGRRFLRRVDGRLSLVDNADGDCVFWDGGCTVYPARPRQCRTFPFWGEHLASPGAWQRLVGTCPGSGQGRHYSLAEIVEISKGRACTGSSEAVNE